MAQETFKHLSEEEIIAAREFLKVVPRPNRLEFDVALRVQEKKEESEEKKAWAKAWEYLTAKKIDMVLHYDDKIMLVEVKKKLSASAAGQLLLYKDLYLSQFQPKKPLELWHVAIFCDASVIPLLEKLGIKWWCLYAST